MRVCGDNQREDTVHRGSAHRGAEIGGLDRKITLASKAPFDAPRSGNSIELSTQLAFEGGYPWYELEAQTVVDHGKPARGERQPTPINPGDLLSHAHGQMPQPGFRGKTPSDRIELSTAQPADQITPDRDLPPVSSG